jgi:CDGSH-type Zn-finger protein/truncated hemoglobin YjbI
MPGITEPDWLLAESSNEAVGGLLDEASGLVGELELEPLRQIPDAAERIGASVIRPLRAVLGRTGPQPPAPPRSPAALATAPTRRLHRLAVAATVLRGRPDPLPEVMEATAALQDLAVRVAAAEGPQALADCLAELAAPMAQVPVGIQVMTDGPYLVANAKQVTDHLGVPVPVRPQMALCRCGASASKPWCDGSHARVGFSGAKDPKRVPDRRESYPGLQVTVLDNRGICAHSGYCTDRLPTAFHAGSEPFVTASGARMDDIVQAARNCPSGALSFAVDGVEQREQVDQAGREPAIEVSKDGPYRVTGGIPLVDGHGEPEHRAAGASLEHYSLCRCGQSQNKPFCSGMHYYVNFADPVYPADKEYTLYEWAGGYPALLRATRIFYQKYVPQEPLLAPLFAAMEVDHPERVAAWLSEVFGGPKFYSQRYGGYERMLSQHIGKGINEGMRSRWAALMYQSVADAGLPNDADFKAAFIAYIEWGSRLAVENSQTTARPPEHMPVPRWWWVCDATPWSRVSALAPEPEEEEQPAALPGPEEQVSFAAHVKPLFRTRDRQSMKFVFDLWSFADVRTHADAILARLRNGTMPCDGAWPAEKVAVFARWVESGKPE